MTLQRLCSVVFFYQPSSLSDHSPHFLSELPDYLAFLRATIFVTKPFSSMFIKKLLLNQSK